MEIRTSVTKYVTDRIAATRQAQSLLPANSVDTKPGGYQNVSVIKANSMKHMPNFFAKGQVRPFFPLEKMGQGIPAGVLHLSFGMEGRNRWC